MVMHVDSTLIDKDFALLSAYVDGELESAVAACLEQRLAQERDLQARLDALQLLQEQLQEVTRAAADGSPVPESIRELLQPQPAGIRSVPHRWASLPGTARRGLAMAASLGAIAVLLLAPQWQGDHADHDALLTAALETNPSRADGWDSLEDGRKLRAVLSFPGRDGSWCREYILATDGHAVRGVACRDSGTWENRVTAAETLLPGAEEAAYRPASAGDSTIIASFIARHMAGDAAGPDTETQLIGGNWQ